MRSQIQNTSTAGSGFLVRTSVDLIGTTTVLCAFRLAVATNVISLKAVRGVAMISLQMPWLSAQWSSLYPNALANISRHNEVSHACRYHLCLQHFCLTSQRGPMAPDWSSSGFPVALPKRTPWLPTARPEIWKVCTTRHCTKTVYTQKLEEACSLRTGKMRLTEASGVSLTL